MSYLAELTLRLAAGAMRLSEEDRRKHAGFLAGAQNEDGGFGGRKGTSDLYYTGFALRGLALLGELNEKVAAAAADHLRHRLNDELPSIDALSLIYSAVLLEVTSGIDVFDASGGGRRGRLDAILKPLCRDDGGYAKTDRSPHSGTYHTFLAVSCRQLIGDPLHEASKVVALIRSRQRDDGGFVELGQLKQSGTNPTAAAVGALRLLDAMDEPIKRAAVAFLAGMQGPEGGLRANTRIPVADLLSTFTGLVALADLGALSAVNHPQARRFVRSLEQPDGGFLAGAWDDTADVEYTFYGLGTLALLAELDSGPDVV